MKTRYTADAFIKHGPYNTDLGACNIDLDEYHTYYGSNLDDTVKRAEHASLYGEACFITLETYRPQYNDWETTEHIDYY